MAKLPWSAGSREKIQLWRAAARLSVVTLPPHSVQVVKNSPYDVRVLNAGHNSYSTAALLTDRNIDIKDPFESLSPGHGGALLGGRPFRILGVSRVRSPASSGWRNPRSPGTI